VRARTELNVHKIVKNVGDIVCASRALSCLRTDNFLHLFPNWEGGLTSEFFG
jgi:hypothetical protein